MYIDTKEASPVALQPSLRNLAYVLRHKEMWPEGFVWDYRKPSSCAIGLCEELWEGRSVYLLMLDNKTSLDGSEFGEIDRKIFIRPVSFFKHPFTGRHARMAMVTPEIVADRIDKYLEAA